MLVVANYHYIRENFNYKYPSIFGLTPKQFENQLIELSKYGEFISQTELLSFIDRPFDKNYILITFDDGLSEQFNLAKPILNRLGIPFVFFINTINYTEKKVSLVHKAHIVRSEISSEEITNFINKNFSGRLNAQEKKLAIVNYNYDTVVSAHLKYLLNFKLNRNEQEEIITPLFKMIRDEKQVNKELYFSNKQLKVLSKEDALGSHSHTHIPLGIYPEEDIKDEMEETQRFFKNKFKKECYSISYPYGSYEACNKVMEIGKNNNFKLGFSMERAVNAHMKVPLMLSRFDCNDLPQGKNDLFMNKRLFIDSKKSNWYK
jgi:peptidoglycan/xylan/chitin deacetylase (PgdA/CDA1 family)